MRNIKETKAKCDDSGRPYNGYDGATLSCVKRSSSCPMTNLQLYAALKRGRRRVERKSSRNSGGPLSSGVTKGGLIATWSTSGRSTSGRGAGAGRCHLRRRQRWQQSRCGVHQGLERTVGRQGPDFFVAQISLMRRGITLCWEDL